MPTQSKRRSAARTLMPLAPPPRPPPRSPSEAFNETVEEATQSLYPLIAKNGMDWMYANCSTTAQRGALDWWRPFYAANKPVFEKLYASVETGEETRRTLDANSRATYKADLEKELAELRNCEMWRAGVAVRSLRPENIKTAPTAAAPAAPAASAKAKVRDVE